MNTENSASLTNERLAEIHARHSAATPGPWGVYKDGGETLLDIAADLDETRGGYRARREIARLEDEPLDNDPTHRDWTNEDDWAQVQADADFIAHARDDVPMLLTELAAVRADRDCLAMAVQFATQWTADAPMGLREGIAAILATMPPRTNGADDQAPRCPKCKSDDYGDVDLAWPFGLPENNPNPEISHVVGVCCACEYTTEAEGGE